MHARPIKKFSKNTPRINQSKKPPNRELRSDQRKEALALCIFFSGKLELSVAIPIVADAMSRRRYGIRVATPISETLSVKGRP
jgi:hypothetical protein